MSRLGKVLALAAVVALAGIGVFFAMERLGAPAEPIALGNPPAILNYLQLAPDKPAVPDIAFTDQDGTMIRLADFRGRWVVLNLWATWCTPCVAELPALAELQAELDPQRMAVVAVDVERAEPAKIVAFLKDNGAAALTPYLDRELALMRAFTAYGLPLTLIVDPEGREVARSFGPEEWDNPEVVAYLDGISAIPSGN